jgi:phospholipid/cholesterol/gamma-HCH transport system substrate-binding protein
MSVVAPRVLAPAALVVAAVAVVLTLITGNRPYELHARFVDASQLVDGGSVRLAGRTVGHIEDIGLAPDGQADLRLSIDDGRLTPLHAGTRLTIRALSQSGVANRYIELSPGPANAPALRSGTTLSTDQTSSMVSLDAILDAFGPAQRDQLDQLIAHASLIYNGSGARYFNGMLGQLDPAMAQLDGVTGELADDRAALSRLVRTGRAAAGAIASRRPELAAAVDNTATVLTTLARGRETLTDALGRAPAVLSQTRRTLADIGTAVDALDPALREIPPVTGPLGSLLARLQSTLPQAVPVLATLRGELPGLQRSLIGLHEIAPPTVVALRSAARALLVARPIVRGLRFYGADLLIGVFDGLLGVATGNYDRWGHYVRAEFVEPYQSTLGGIFGGLLARPLAPSLFSLRTHLTRRCPGGNAAPAIDGSNPWIPDRSICTPSQDTPGSVNAP